MNSFPNKILLATDGSADAALAAWAAIDLSNRTASELHVVHSWQSVPSTRFESFIRAQLKQEAEELLTEQEKLIEAGGGKIAGTHLRRGPAVDEILDLARELDAGLIVMGSRGMGQVKRLVLGSVSEGVVHHARSPVLLVRGGEEAWPPARIVVGEDGSNPSTSAGDLAAVIARLSEAKGLLVRVYPTLPERDLEGRELDPRMVDDELRREKRAVEARATEIEEASGMRPQVTIAVGDPAACLIEAAEEYAPERTLIAVGSRGLGAVQRLRVGSVSTKVLRAAKGPVLVVFSGPHEKEGRVRSVAGSEIRPRWGAG
jgi:nucleotide-binding universal stress UspA family protein